MSAPPLGNTLEGGTDTTLISTANSGGASGDAFNNVIGTIPKFSATQARNGLSMQITQTGTGTQANCDWTGLGSLTVSTYIRYYYYTGAWGTGNAVLGDVRTAAAGNCAFFYMSSAGLISVRNAAQAAPANIGTVPLTRNQWVRLEYRILASTTVGEVEWRLFNSPDSTALSDTGLSTAQVLGANIGEARFGSVNSGTTILSNSAYYDDLAVSTTGWLGPSVLPVSTSTFQPLPIMR